MGSGIHQPRGMQSYNGTQEDSPHQERETADCEQCSGNNNHWYPVIFRQPNMCLRFRQVRNVAGESGDVLMKALALQYPSHMRPPLAVDRAVGIAFFIRKLVMNAVRGHPENRAAFERQSSAESKEILHPFRRLVTAMSQQAMVAHPDAETAGNPPQHNRGEKCLPGKKEKCGNSADVKQRHESGCDPVNLIVVTCALERFNL